MFALLSAIATFAAIASAVPAPVASAIPAPAHHGDFIMLMQHNVYPYPKIVNSSLVLTYDHAAKQHYVVGVDEAKRRGTPARASNYENNYAANLSMISHGKEYFLSTIDAGEVYGIHSPVSASTTFYQPQWSVGDYVYHELTAASNLLMACNITVNGEIAPVLSFGDVTSQGNIPENCTYASVFTKFH